MTSLIRRDPREPQALPESHYGKFTRSGTLPEGADARHIDPLYDSGILEVSVPLPQKAAAECPCGAIRMEPEQI